jgi:predicted nucleic acid-binding protein
VRALCSISRERLTLNDQAEKRAHEFQRHGVKVADSLHLAIAEAHQINIFLTTDDSFLRAVKRIKTNITVANPASWLMEILQNE